MHRPSIEPSILIVEDNDDLRLVLKISIAQRFGYRIIETAHGERAITLATKEQPSLILMDLKLPDMDGLDAICMIQANHRTKHIPIIVVSDHCWDADVSAKAKACGALHCIDKAHFVDKLPPLIESLIEKHKE